MDIFEKKMYKIGYIPKFSNNTNQKKRRTSIMFFIRKNKIMVISLAVFFLAVCINFALLYNFFCILEKIN